MTQKVKPVTGRAFNAIDSIRTTLRYIETVSNSRAKRVTDSMEYAGMELSDEGLEQLALDLEWLDKNLSRLVAEWYVETASRAFDIPGS